MHKNTNHGHSNKGYTLVELLGVVVIILIFSTILVSSNRNATRGAQSVTYQQQQAELQSAVEAWISTQPSLSTAITAWAADSTPATILARAQTMMSHNSTSSFSIASGKITTSASLAQDPPLGFVVTWGSGTSDRLTQGPIVTAQ